MRNEKRALSSEDLHLSRNYSRTLPINGDEVSHLYDILKFITIFYQRTF